MPNIEIHGLNVFDGCQVKVKIDELLDKKSYRDEYVIEFIYSDVRDRKGIRQPYLRLITTIDDDRNDIISELSKIGMDIEAPPPTLFIPKTTNVP